MNCRSPFSTRGKRFWIDMFGNCFFPLPLSPGGLEGMLVFSRSGLARQGDFGERSRALRGGVQVSGVVPPHRGPQSAARTTGARGRLRRAAS